MLMHKHIAAIPTTALKMIAGETRGAVRPGATGGGAVII
jgi:hypothetical protein